MGEIELGNVHVADVMNPDPPVVEKTAGVCKVARLLRRHSHVWVVQDKDSRKVLGVVTERDFLDLLNPLPDLMYTTGMFRTRSLYHGEMSSVEEFMTSPAFTCRSDDTVADALEELWLKRIRHLAVVKDGCLVGELSMKGIIAAYYITSCSMMNGA